jgi:hypothetical protein
LNNVSKYIPSTPPEPKHHCRNCGVSLGAAVYLSMTTQKPLGCTKAEHDWTTTNDNPWRNK